MLKCGGGKEIGEARALVVITGDEAFGAGLEITKTGHAGT